MAWILLGMKIIPFIFGAITAVEHFFTNIHGNDKKNAAMDMITTFLTATEGVAGKDLLNDNEVRIATGKVIDAIVALQNVISTRAGKPNQ